MKSTLFFVLTVAITLSGDILFKMALVWNTLKEQGSIQHLGIILALMTIAPVIVQRCLPKLKQSIYQTPALVFSRIRIIGVVFSILLITLPTSSSIYTIYFTACIFAILVYFTQQSLETTISHLVAEKKLKADFAAKTLQASIQSAAFIGLALGGYLLDTYSMQAVYIALLATMLTGILIPIAVKELTTNKIEEKNEKATLDKQTDDFNQAIKTNITLCLCAFILLAIQLGSFNFLIPIIFQKLKLWSAMDYGIMMALVGLGALATSVSQFNKSTSAVVLFTSYILMPSLPIAVSIIENKYCVYFLSFFSGYSFSYIRMQQRIRVYSLTTNKTVSSQIAAKLTAVNLITAATIPLAVSYMLLILENQFNIELLGIIGFIVSCLIISLFHLQSRIINNNFYKLNIG